MTEPKPKVLIPELLPPASGNGDAGARARTGTGPAPRALRPVAAGLILDLADFLTAGPVGFAAGFLVGGAVAFWLGSSYRLTRRDKWLLTLLSGAYCTLPFTALLPLGTLVGAFVEAAGRRRERSRPADRPRRAGW